MSAWSARGSALDGFATLGLERRSPEDGNVPYGTRIGDEGCSPATGAAGSRMSATWSASHGWRLDIRVYRARNVVSFRVA